MNRSLIVSPLLLLLISNTTCVAATSTNENPGKALYQTTCKLCHAPEKAEAMKAPAAFNVEAWQQRFTLAKQKIKTSTQFNTINDYLYYQISIGKGLMHHGGLCKESTQLNPNLKCDKADYLAAIDYMSNKSD